MNPKLLESTVSYDRHHLELELRPPRSLRLNQADDAGEFGNLSGIQTPPAREFGRYRRKVALVFSKKFLCGDSLPDFPGEVGNARDVRLISLCKLEVGYARLRIEPLCWSAWHPDREACPHGCEFRPA